MFGQKRNSPGRAKLLEQVIGQNARKLAVFCVKRGKFPLRKSVFGWFFAGNSCFSAEIRTFLLAAIFAGSNLLPPSRKKL